MRIIRLLSLLFLSTLVFSGSVAAAVNLDINKILSRYHLSEAQVSISIVSLRDGRTLFEHNPDKALNPASTMKILTTVAAFEVISVNFRKQSLVSINLIYD